MPAIFHHSSGSVDVLMPSGRPGVSLLKKMATTKGRPGEHEHAGFHGNSDFTTILQKKTISERFGTFWATQVPSRRRPNLK